MDHALSSKGGDNKLTRHVIRDRLLYVGFHFGTIYGCLLSPQTGQPRPEAATPVTLTHPDTAHGY
jgi:hypothetical protein